MLFEDHIRKSVNHYLLSLLSITINSIERLVHALVGNQRQLIDHDDVMDLQFITIVINSYVAIFDGRYSCFYRIVPFTYRTFGLLGSFLRGRACISANIMSLDLIFSPSTQYSLRTVYWATWNKENNWFPVRYKPARPISGEALKDKPYFGDFFIKICCPIIFRRSLGIHTREYT